MSGLCAFRRCDRPRLLSSLPEHVALFDSAFTKLDQAMRGQGYSITRWRLWRFADGSFIARCEWRLGATSLGRLRWTVTGDNLLFLRCAPGLA